MIPIYFVTFDIMKDGMPISRGSAVFPYKITHWSLILSDFEERLVKARKVKENETIIIITSASIVGETEEEDGAENYYTF